MTPHRIVAVIPARLASTRLPRKVLLALAGRPMLAWIYAAARACPQLDHILVATDSTEVLDLCRSLDIPARLTAPELPSGSDRVHAVSQALAAEGHPAEILVNIQGDEPLLHPDHLTALLAPFASPEVHVTTLKVPCAPADLHNPNAVKVVTAPDGRALYFSRATIPYDRDGIAAPIYKHLGLYAYRAAALQRFHALPPSPLELTERLEQLRFLENGISIHVALTPHDTIGVDTPEDLARAESALLHRLELQP